MGAGANDREAVKVIVRCRPFSNKEKEAGHSCIVNINEDTGSVAITNPESPGEPPKSFTFDCVFSSECHQIDVYNKTARPIVDSVLEGYNGTIFAYGQTGTGKTFSMEGIRDVPDLRGIIPNSFEHIFSYISRMGQDKKFLVRASYLEIYNEEIRDLLSKNPTAKLDLKERADVGVYVKDLSSFVVKSVDEMDKLMNVGNKNRSVGFTQMNATSSRSHSIFTITVECSEKGEDGEEHIRAGKLNLVDLAGSERQAKTGASGDRLKEATKINLSLSALGNVISALVDGKSSHIPYRDSKLTRLLQDSLGGNARTMMIATMSPASYNYDETLGTLRYANRTKNIKNKPKINEDPKDAMLREFQQEIERLKAQLAQLETGGEGKEASGQIQDEEEEEEEEEDEEEEEEEEEEVEEVEEIEEVEEVEEVEEEATDGQTVSKQKTKKPKEPKAPKVPKQPKEAKGNNNSSKEATTASATSTDVSKEQQKDGSKDGAKPPKEKKIKEKKPKEKKPKNAGDESNKQAKAAAAAAAAAEKKADAIAAIQAQIEDERRRLLESKDMAEEEKRRVAEELEARAQEVDRERQERDALAEKLKAMEEKLLIGGVNMLDHTEKQAEEIAKRELELEERRRNEQELENELEAQLESHLQIEEEYTSLQEEANAKTKKLKKLWAMLMSCKSEIRDLQEEFQREREDTLETIRDLTRDLKLKILVIDSFIPPDQLRLVEEHAVYEEGSDRWRIYHLSRAGNNVKGKRVFMAGTDAANSHVQLRSAMMSNGPGDNTNGGYNGHSGYGGSPDEDGYGDDNYGHSYGQNYNYNDGSSSPSLRQNSPSMRANLAAEEIYLTYDDPALSNAFANARSTTPSSTSSSLSSSSSTSKKARPVSRSSKAARDNAAGGSRAASRNAASVADSGASASGDGGDNIPKARGLVKKEKRYA